MVRLQITTSDQVAQIEPVPVFLCLIQQQLNMLGKLKQPLLLVKQRVKPDIFMQGLAVRTLDGVQNCDVQNVAKKRRRTADLRPL
jgi:hypothetical protein